MNNERKFWHIKKRFLVLLAGIMWLIAGFNVIRLGIIAYIELSYIPFWFYLLSIVVFIPFGLMFYKMTKKHIKRIKAYPEEYRPFWNFFDLKAYIIMIIMMSGGISLRVFHLVPVEFIAIFYTGLGTALTLAGIIFIFRFWIGEGQTHPTE